MHALKASLACYQRWSLQKDLNLLAHHSLPDKWNCVSNNYEIKLRIVSAYSLPPFCSKKLLLIPLNVSVFW
jgi:hypothetical protein